MKKVTLDITVCDYDLIVAAIPSGRSCWDGRRTSPTNQDSSTGRRHWRIHEGQSLSGTSSRTPNQMRMTKKTRTGKRRRRTRTKIRMTRRTGIRKKAKRRKVMGRRRRTTKRRKRSRLLQEDKVTIANQN